MRVSAPSTGAGASAAETVDLAAADTVFNAVVVGADGVAQTVPLVPLQRAPSLIRSDLPVTFLSAAVVSAPEFTAPTSRDRESAKGQCVVVTGGAAEAVPAITARLFVAGACLASDAASGRTQHPFIACCHVFPDVVM